jgi:mannose-6-phosphate isomerase-like protein (cupin superfamily)
MKPDVLEPNPGGEFLTPERCFILELFNKPDDRSVSVAQARVEPNVTTQLHRLVGVDERYVITDGVGEVEIGETKKPVRRGDIVMIPAGTPQRITNVGQSDLSFLCLCTPRFDPSAYEALES